MQKHTDSMLVAQSLNTMQAVHSKLPMGISMFNQQILSKWVLLQASTRSLVISQ